MATTQQTEVTEQTLQNLHARIEGLDELVVLHRDGTLLGGLYPTKASEQIIRIAPQFANLTDEICHALEQGVSTEAIVKGTERFVAIYKASECNIFLAIVGKKGVNFGLLSSGCRRALETLQQIFQK